MMEQSTQGRHRLPKLGEIVIFRADLLGRRGFKGGQDRAAVVSGLVGEQGEAAVHLTVFEPNDKPLAVRNVAFDQPTGSDAPDPQVGTWRFPE